MGSPTETVLPVGTTPSATDAVDRPDGSPSDSTTPPAPGPGIAP